MASHPLKQWARGQGQFCFHDFRTYSDTHGPLGTSLLCFPGEMQGPLLRVLQLVRGRDSSSTLMVSERTLPPIKDKGWVKKAISSLPTPPYARWQLWPDIKCSLVLVANSTVNSVSSVVLPRWDAGSSFWVLQKVRMKVNSLTYHRWLTTSFFFSSF